MPSLKIGGFVPFNTPRREDGQLLLPGSFEGLEESRVDLLIDHDPHRLLASTRDGSLNVWADDRRLFFVLRRPAPEILDAVQQRRCQGVSAAYTALETEERALTDRTVQVVTRAQLHELSLAFERIPRRPGTRVFPFEMD